MVGEDVCALLIVPSISCIAESSYFSSDSGCTEFICGVAFSRCGDTGSDESCIGKVGESSASTAEGVIGGGVEDVCARGCGTENDWKLWFRRNGDITGCDNCGMGLAKMAERSALDDGNCKPSGALECEEGVKKGLCTDEKPKEALAGSGCCIDSLSSAFSMLTSISDGENAFVR